MRVVFDARTWTASLFMAVEDYWRATGVPVEVTYVTHHPTAARLLARERRPVIDITSAVREMRLADPWRELERLEAHYDGFLWPLPRYLLSERYFRGRSPDWQISQLARQMRFFHELYERLQPELFVGSLPDIMPLWLAQDMAPAHDCEPVGLATASFPRGRFLVLRRHRELPGARERFETYRSQGLTDPLRATVADLQSTILHDGELGIPAREGAHRLTRLLSPRLVAEQVRRSIERLRDKRSGAWFVGRDPILSAYANSFFSIRARLADRLSLTDAPQRAPYVFYPLHFEPEAALAMYGSYFEGQLEVIRNLARSLPIGWRLVVKEHPVMRGRRPLRYYQTLRSIPNVRLLPFDVPTFRVIRGAELVAVVAGTAGLEASAIGKPVLMFGEAPWDYAPTIHKVGPLFDLPDQILNVSAHQPGPDHPDVQAFILSWAESLPEGRVVGKRRSEICEPRNVARVADAIRQRSSGSVRVEPART